MEGDQTHIQRPGDQAAILVVDDNPLIVDVLRGLLRSESYKVFTASHGKQALEYLGSKKIDVVICDVMMPKMGGYELHSMVREKAELSHIPFIFLTALNSHEERVKGKESGADDYIAKPFEPRELLAVVKGKVTRARGLKISSEQKYDNYRRRVIHTLSHEFRTPLVAINTGMELLMEHVQGEKDNRTRSLLDAVKRGGQRLEKLVQDFMILQQIDAGIAERTYETRAQRISVKDLLGRFFDSKTEVHTLNGFTIKLHDDTDGAKVKVVEAHINDCLDRLLSNAVKFSKDDKQIEIASYLVQDEVNIDIKDRGIGLDPDKLDEAIDVFGQINRDKLEQQGGGLGLPIATRYALINKGRLEFEPRNGGGSVVSLVLPVER